ncbi:MAG: DUF1858 domain-containing protein [Gemmataceae bacterium]
MARTHGSTAAAAAASSAEVLAVLLFAGITLATLRRSSKPWAVHDAYIVSAIAWFVVQTICENAYLALTLTASGPDLIRLVSTWQAPLRDIQIHGFVLLMILGVSQRLFHPMYGLPMPSARLARVSLVLIHLAVIGEASGLVLMRSQSRAWAGLWYGSVLLLAGTATALVRNWRLFSAAKDTDRSLKFLRIAYVWLFVSLAMLVALPLYQFVLLRIAAPESHAVQIGFSHAYYGAARHAITVGFASLMIVGVAAKVTATLNGIDSRQLSELWAPFVLINLGCSIRVVGQTLTDFFPAAFPVAGVSGMLEVAGLTLWGVHLWNIMNGRFAGSSQEPEVRIVAPEERIVASHRVGDVLDVHPHLLGTLVEFGFRPLQNAALRATLAKRVTLEAACRWTGADLEQLLETLNKRAKPRELSLKRHACCG